ncbi:hypothetical protein ACLOJK_030578, partial [Asimina triloba]
MTWTNGIGIRGHPAYCVERRTVSTSKLQGVDGYPNLYLVGGTHWERWGRDVCAGPTLSLTSQGFINSWKPTELPAERFRHPSARVAVAPHALESCHRYPCLPSGCSTFWMDLGLNPGGPTLVDYDSPFSCGHVAVDPRSLHAAHY